MRSGGGLGLRNHVTDPGNGLQQLDLCCHGRHACTITASSSANAYSTKSSRRNIERASCA